MNLESKESTIRLLTQWSEPLATVQRYNSDALRIAFRLQRLSAMSYVELIKSGAPEAAVREYLSGGEQVAITIRMPKNLHESSKEAAAMRGMSFSALVRQGLIQQLAAMR